jgi:hypothetical protein
MSRSVVAQFRPSPATGRSQTRESRMMSMGNGGMMLGMGLVGVLVIVVLVLGIAALLKYLRSK